MIPSVVTILFRDASASPGRGVLVYRRNYYRSWIESRNFLPVAKMSLFTVAVGVGGIGCGGKGIAII